MIDKVFAGRAAGMRRMLAALAFLFGGLSVEAVKPLQCSLICASQPRRSGKDKS